MKFEDQNVISDVTSQMCNYFKSKDLGECFEKNWAKNVILSFKLIFEKLGTKM